MAGSEKKENIQPVRIDKWLWAARFFKTRSLASKAVAGGKVTINGQRVKPSRTVNISDTVVIHKGQDEFCVAILDLADRRGPARQAVLLYEESPESIEKRKNDRQERAMLYAGQTMPAKRPGKRDRRKIKEFIRKT